MSDGPASESLTGSPQECISDKIEEYRGTSLIRNHTLSGPSTRTMPRARWWSLGWGAFSYERGTAVVPPRVWQAHLWNAPGIQGNLTHQKPRGPPPDRHRALGIVLR
jgi:hypothetical protein